MCQHGAAHGALAGFMPPFCFQPRQASCSARIVVEAAISQELKDFVHERIATPNEVPVLLWLWSHPEQRLTPAALAASVGFNETACADALDDLVRSGLSVCMITWSQLT